MDGATLPPSADSSRRRREPRDRILHAHDRASTIGAAAVTQLDNVRLFIGGLAEQSGCAPYRRYERRRSPSP